MENTDQLNKEVKKTESANGGGDGEKKIGKSTSSTRWGQEGLSTKDCGQHPAKLRSLGERDLSGFDDNTTTVGQPGDRKSLTVIDSVDNKQSLRGKQEKSDK